MRLTARSTVAVAVAVLTGTGLAACGSSGSATPGAPSAAATSADPTVGLVGSGCDDYARQMGTGAGSVGSMAAQKLATAASGNPLLSTLTAAVSGKLNKKVDLVDMLNGGQFTVFAPVDAAFQAVPKKRIATVVANDDTLTKVLTYHVVLGQITPQAIDGKHVTLEGESLKVAGSGDALTVNGASVICGGVRTTNATVYLIDGVLTPPSLQKKS